MTIEYIIKRDFTTKSFDLNKITEAIQKAMLAVGVGTEQNAGEVAYRLIKNSWIVKMGGKNIYRPSRKFKI